MLALEELYSALVVLDLFPAVRTAEIATVLRSFQVALSVSLH
jgi:hypothetical protein